ncbi:4-hydroxythreonine-4-phosphate dehydrogenase PdxA [Pelagibius sp. CAU 1746]|uniref:4-hydroxythreonine-4-phosphate dehydrogenase PdxA n=1 Tax=Pelagibius sp. CAU 1746 TaxID=3140370 RepID=UPI00325B517F
MGEPAGIGGETTLLAWRRRYETGSPVFFVIDDPQRLGRLAGLLGWEVPIQAIGAPDDAMRVFADALPVLPLPQPVASEPGRLDPANAEAVLEAIRQGVALTLEGTAAGVVTNPIHKLVLMESGFEHPGHTEFLAELCASEQPPVMMLACAALRVVPVTVHLPLRRVPEVLTTEGIVQAGRVTAQALQRRFGIAAPRLAISGLNPHAGEGGRLGNEESTIIAPAVRRLQEDGIAAFGPVPADTLFHAAARRNYDAALCMYHDQALIPIKTIDFDGGVNVTLGLPIIRTSPDHGTALDIAGQGTASPASLEAALRTAAEMSAASQAFTHR